MSRDWILLGPASSDHIFISYVSKTYREIVAGDLKCIYPLMDAIMISVICSAMSYLSLTVYQVQS